MTEEKKYYRVGCVDGSCMGFTSDEPDLLVALKRLYFAFPSKSARTAAMSLAYAHAELAIKECTQSGEEVV